MLLILMTDTREAKNCAKVHGCYKEIATARRPSIFFIIDKEMIQTHIHTLYNTNEIRKLSMFN